MIGMIVEKEVLSLVANILYRLRDEEKGGKWLWPVDTVAPIEI
jgi:hypothetical protein